MSTGVIAAIVTGAVSILGAVTALINSLRAKTTAGSAQDTANGTQNALNTHLASEAHNPPVTPNVPNPPAA